jgi:hypothetical protein
MSGSPQLVSFVIGTPLTVTLNQAAGQADPTNASPINFMVVFSESVANFATGDVTLSGTAGATTATVTGSGTTYNVGVSGMTASGTVIASIAAGKASDSAGNLNTAATSTDSTVTIDTPPPTVTDVTSSTANGAYKDGTVIPVTVTFSEAVLVTGTPQLTLETGSADAVVNYSSGSGTTTLTFQYTVAAGHTSPDLDYVATGSLALNGGTIRDAATNNATLTLPAPGTTHSLGANKAIVIDTTAPTAGITYSIGHAVRDADTLTITATFSEPLADAPVVKLGIAYSGGIAALTATAMSKTDSTHYTYSLNVPAGNGIGTVALSVGTDLTGNLVTAAPTSGATFVVDNTPPTVVISAPSSATASTGPVTYTVTYSGADTVTLTAGNVTLNRTGTADGSVAVSGSGTATRTVTLSSLTGDGTLGISLAAGTASDSAVNLAPAAGPSQTFTVAGPLPLMASPATVGFGAVVLGDTAILSVLVSNPGAASVTVQGVSASPSAFTVDDFVGTLEAGDVLFIPVAFAPAAAVSYSGTLELTTTAGSIRVPLTGSGTTAPVRLELGRMVTPPLAVDTLVDVPVQLANPTGLAVLSFRIEFDATRFEFAEFVADTARVTKTPDVSTPAADAVLVVIADLAGDGAVLAGDGLIGTLRLRSTAALEAAVVPLLVTAVSATDATMNSVTVAARNGEIQIGAVVPTVDVDNDGQTNFRDVVLIYRRLMGLPTVKEGWTLPAGETETTANARIDDLQEEGFDGFAPLDVDRGGASNFRDVVFLYRRLMGLPTLKPGWALPAGETEATVNARIDNLRKF